MTSFNDHWKADAIDFPLTKFIRKTNLQTNKKNTPEVKNIQFEDTVNNVNPLHSSIWGQQSNYMLHSHDTLLLYKVSLYTSKGCSLWLEGRSRNLRAHLSSKMTRERT